MELLFKVTNPPTDGNSATVGHTNFLDHYPSFHKSAAWASLKPFVRQATQSYVLKYIDAATYNALATKFQDDASLDASETELLEKLQDAIAYYSVWEAMPHINVIMGDKGVQQSASPEGGSMPSSQWAFKGARWETMRKADDLLDHCLSWIESEIAADNNLFDVFKASEEYKVGKSSLFKTPAELQKYVDIRSSRRTFLALNTHIEEAAEKHVLPVICKDLWTEMVDQYRNNALTAVNKKLLPILQKVVAKWGAHQAIPSLTVVMENSGFKVISSSDGMFHRRNLENEQHLQAIKSLEYRLESDGKSAKAELFKFIYDNVDDYPLFKASDCYIDDDVDEYSPICPGDGGMML